MAERNAGVADGILLENVKERLAPGYYVDLAVMQNDPLLAQDEANMDNVCLATMVGGRWIYGREA